MAPDGACEVTQSTARSNAKSEAERFRKAARVPCLRSRNGRSKNAGSCSSIIGIILFSVPLLRISVFP